MCVVSMVMDHYQNEFEKFKPWDTPQPLGPNQAGRLAALEEKVEEMRRLLERARQYDEDNGEPDCELDSKRQALKKLAEELGVEIDFI